MFKWEISDWGSSYSVNMHRLRRYYAISFSHDNAVDHNAIWTIGFAIVLVHFKKCRSSLNRHSKIIWRKCNFKHSSYLFAFFSIHKIWDITNLRLKICLLWRIRWRLRIRNETPNLAWIGFLPAKGGSWTEATENYSTDWGRIVVPKNDWLGFCYSTSRIIHKILLHAKTQCYSF